ncbi:ATP-binding protein [Methanolobus vulcani]|uniref:Histidine kinase domain-containing protein n=1 Tax=Methanolobus vulcani TaxID=38026 RepID=A0A7Z8KMJ9_9EURY|nr:ATP-binding protein [Methanolobus vulcani]TQD23578.1 hypothetical protein FKV42_13740 [Methanolobus vulcani]
MNNSHTSFKTRARLINQLGEQLIKNESIALLELIKNSYDADASECNVIIHNPSIPEKGEIIIQDNGEGMDYKILSTSWLELGTSYKDDLRNNPDTKRSNQFGRLRIGEKGIGRLGVHRLGKQIEIITRKVDSKEYVLTIDWNNIEKSKYIEDFPVFISEREPTEFVSGSGTKLVIKKLRVPWTRKLVRECARSVTSLNSPFDSDDSFRVNFELPDSDWLKGILTFQDIEQYKLYSFDIKMEEDKISSFMYEFTPWPTMTKLIPRTITHNDGKMGSLLRMVAKKGRNDFEDIDLSKFKIGEIRFKGVIFDRDPKILSLGVQDKQGLKKYLNENGGIKVFRDNMRVLDYGEQENDWLNLGGRRVNMPAKRISKNIILGAVYLNHEHSTDLKEKANREGFVENEAYYEFWKAVNFSLERVESLRNTDKDILRKHYGPQKVSEPVFTSISELKAIVDDKIKDTDTKHEINRYIDRIEDEYELITNSLITSAGAGLNLVMLIHEIEKMIKEIRGMLEDKSPSEELNRRFESLSLLVDGYSILVKSSEKKVRDLRPIVSQAIFNVGYRLEKHNIKINSAFTSRTEKTEALCSENHLLSALMNIFDNSIWWLNYYKIEMPEIYVDISNEFPGHMSIIIADNGLGFTSETSEIIKPFVTDKPDGMGIGLHLTHQIMEALEGQLLFPEMEIFDIPEKFENGAIVALAFKTGGK